MRRVPDGGRSVRKHGEVRRRDHRRDLDKNGRSCSATANAIVAPDGNSTADTTTAATATPIIQQQVAGLASGGQYTFYVWGKVASGTKQVSIAIVDNAYAGD